MKNKKEKSQDTKSKALSLLIIVQLILLLVIQHLPFLKINTLDMTLIYCLLDIITVCLAGVVINRGENPYCIVFELILSILLIVHFICCLYVFVDISLPCYDGNLMVAFPKS